MRWGMQRGAGLRVQAGSEVAEVDTVVVVRMGFLPAPCRVVYVIDEPDIRGFAYGTLPGHPESGEERFVVRHDPVTSAVFAEVTAFSRPATWWSKAARPWWRWPSASSPNAICAGSEPSGYRRAMLPLCTPCASRPSATAPTSNPKSRNATS